MNISTSTDITKLLVRFIIDLSDKEPRLFVKNMSEGQNLGAVIMAFEAFSPNGIPIHRGSLDTPDTVGNFGQIQLTSVFPKYQNVLEWSGNPYRFTVSALDSEGKKFIYIPTQQAVVVPPAGNAAAGKHYGASKLMVDVDCGRGELQVKDTTNYSYAGRDPIERISDTITILAPEDETGVVPAPAEYPNFTQVIHPLSFSGLGYKAIITSVREYDLGEEVHLIVRYNKSVKFDVNCNYDLCPLFKEYGKLLDKAAVSCDAKLNTTIGLINAKLMKAVTAIMQPLCGFNIGKLIEEIKVLGNFEVDCNCASGSHGFSLSPNSVNGFNYEFNTAGDIVASAQQIGNNVLIDISDYKYIFNVVAFGDPTSPQAFKIEQNTNGRTRTYSLSVNRTVLASEMLESIATDTQLLDRLRTLTASNYDFIVDGKSIIQTNERCDQELTIAGVPADGTFVMFNTITIDGIEYIINQSFNGTAGSIAQLNTRLAALNQGQIVASYSEEDGGVLRIATAQNAHKMSKGKLFFPAVVGAAAYKTMMFRESNCSNSVPYTPSTIVQAIIDYVVKLTADNVKIGSELSFCQIESDGKIKEVVLHATDSLSELLKVLRNNACRAVSTPTNNGTVNCELIKAVFNERLEVIQPTDYLLGTRNGKCGQWDIDDVFNELTSHILTSNDPDLQNKWADVVQLVYIGDEENCNPVSYMEARMGILLAEDFPLIAGACVDAEESNCIGIVYVGFYTGEQLDFPVTIRLRDQIISSGVMGVQTQDFIMAQGTSRRDDVNSGLPDGTLQAGRRWVVDQVILPAAGLNKKYLHIKVKNNGAKNYRVAYRIKGSAAEFSYVSIPAQPKPAAYTIAVFDVPENEYEVSAKTLCGPGIESTAIQVGATSCPAALSFNANKSGQDILITYKFPAGITRFNLRIQLPNNGTFNQVLDVQESGQYVYPIPGATPGVYVIDLRAVCNEATGWFGPFTGPIPVQVSESANSCPIVVGVSVNNITESAARITILPPLETSFVVGYTVIISSTGVDSKSYTATAANPVVEVIGLQPSKRWTVQVITNCTPSSGSLTSSTFNAGIFFTTAATGNFRAYWGAKDIAGNLTVSQIKASANSAEFEVGSDVVADWMYNTLAKYLWLAIPSSESNKTNWAGVAPNLGAIGNFPLTFGGPVGVTDGTESFDFYITNFKTKQSNSTITFS